VRDLNDLRELCRKLKVIESIAILPVATSTNALGKRVIDECIDNEIAIPSAAVVARRQLEGRGRGTHVWSSPEGGLYVSILHTRRTEEAAFLPLEAAVAVATFLEESFGIAARLKWPNDILVDGKKIAGILIEARIVEEETLATIGIGINVIPVEVPGAKTTSIAESSRDQMLDVHTLTLAFIESFDSALARHASPSETLERWRSLSIHRQGEAVTAVVGEQRIEGTWEGIDESGRALVRHNGGVTPISAGEIFSLAGGR
jgi:BirA family transcriptional regulator, biotin operon repressor / biotin---[acetyl-CoA-carboxylase] ligase